LHYDAPDVDAEVEDDDYEETEPCSLALSKGLHVENETEAEATDTVIVSSWNG